MSTWTDLHRALKQMCTAAALTPTQKEAYDRICYLLQAPEWINLYGQSGAGKTYLAWAVAHATRAMYKPLPARISDVETGTRVVLLDNAPVREVAVRRLLSECELRHVLSVVLVTRDPVDLAIRRVELRSPSEEDLLHVKAEVGRLGYHVGQNGSVPIRGYWDLLLTSI